MNSPSDALRARVLAAAAAKPSPTRRDGRRAGIAATALSIAVAVGVFELGGGFAHSAARPLAITLGLAGGWAAASALLTALTITRGRSTLARRPALLANLAIAAPFVLFAWMQAFHGGYEEPEARLGLRCLAFVLAVAAVPLASFLWLRRGVEPRRPSALGAAAGAMCGAWAGVVIDLWCPLTNPSHALVGHVLPLALLVGIGAAVGNRTLGVRAPS